MSVVSLVLAILGLILSVAGPVIGGLVAGGASVFSAFSGIPSLVEWPLWVFGIGLGCGVPAVAVVLGVLGLSREDNKGVAIAGTVVGAVALCGGVLLGGGSVMLARTAAQHIPDDTQQHIQKAQDDMQNAIDQINDPAFQDQFQKAMQQIKQGDARQQMKPMKPMNPVDAGTAAPRDAPDEDAQGSPSAKADSAPEPKSR